MVQFISLVVQCDFGHFADVYVYSRQKGLRNCDFAHIKFSMLAVSRDCARVRRAAQPFVLFWRNFYFIFKVRLSTFK